MLSFCLYKTILFIFNICWFYWEVFKFLFYNTIPDIAEFHGHDAFIYLLLIFDRFLFLDFS